MRNSKDIYTFDIERKDGGERNAFIRLRTPEDREEDTFSTLEQIYNTLSDFMSYEITKSKEVETIERIKNTCINSLDKADHKRNERIHRRTRK